jgi:histidinol phosphatase-like PHP family hydrolase
LGVAEEKSEECLAALIEAIRNGSVANLAHFNLHVEFDFTDERMVDSIGLTPLKNGVWKSH